MQPTWGLVGGDIVEKTGLRGDAFKGPSRGMRGDALTCRGHQYMFCKKFYYGKYISRYAHTFYLKSSTKSNIPTPSTGPFRDI